jgi:hypothetical protein
LIVSFFVPARFWQAPRLQEPYRGRPLPMGLQRLVDAPALRLALRLVGLAAAGRVAGQPGPLGHG